MPPASVCGTKVVHDETAAADGVVVLEVDWDAVTGCDYWNPLTQEGRLALETARVRKCCFRKLAAGARAVAPSPPPPPPLHPWF